MTEQNEKELQVKIYEAGVLLLPSISDDKIASEFGKIKEAFATHKVAVISEEFPKMRILSYTIDKFVASKKESFDRAYFGWIKFESDKESISEIKKIIDNNPNIIRGIVVETIRETPAFHVRPTTRPTTFKPPMTTPEKVAPATPASLAEIDKSIEELIKE